LCSRVESPDNWTGRKLREKAAEAVDEGEEAAEPV
jgi:hypothetical protein